MDKKVLWTASLSNGETIYEEKGNFKTMPGKPSPWQRFLIYCAENELQITSLGLYTKDGRRFNVPSAGTNPKFNEFRSSPKPIGYKFFRKAAQEAMQQGNTRSSFKIVDQFAVIEAQYQDGYAIQLWVEEISQNSFILLTNGNTPTQ